MPFKNFSDFTYIPGNRLLPTDYLVGYREFNAEIRTQLQDLTVEMVKNLDLKVAPEVLYVNKNGKDSNKGTSDVNAFKTLKRACAAALEVSRVNMTDAGRAAEERIQQATNGAFNGYGVGSKQVNIFIRTGDYIEDNPIYVPPGVTIIGDNLRAVTIIPKNRFFDILWVNHRCYVWGFTFRTHLKPSYAVSFPEFKQVSGLPVALQSAFDPLIYEKYSSDSRLNEAINLHETKFNDAEFTSTKELGTNSNDLTQDTGSNISDPWTIAFLTRYFANFGTTSTLITPEEVGIPFTDTSFYRNTVRRPYVLTSPYPQGNSSITNATSPGANDAGGGVLVDGFKVDGPLRSMVMDSYTQFNEGGKGIHIKNNGYAQLVSTFTICCTEGVICETGGTCSINTSNCSFGLSGLVALGKSTTPTLRGKLEQPINTLTNTIYVYNLGMFKDEHEIGFEDDIQPYPGQIFEIRFSPPGGGGEVTVNNDGVLFNMLSATKVEKDGINGYKSTIILERNYSPITDDSMFNVNNSVIPKDADVYFYIRSTITTSAHTMEYIGTGTVLLSAVPQKGGQTDTSTEAVYDTEGRVFFTSTNQLGDFRIGQDLTIVQSKGIIEGETFERSILTLITPFTIAMATAL